MYVYGKTEKRTAIVDGRVRKTYKHGKPFDRWEVMIKDHHDVYIDWSEFERNQKQLALNAYGKVDGVKSGRGGRSLLAGMLCCGRCGRRLSLAYSGRGGNPVYRCDRPNMQYAKSRCFNFGGRRPDEAVTRELLRAVEPMAVAAALQAQQRHMEVQADQRRIGELELQQARYEASLAERRYAACDPDNRLIAAQLEKSWEAALQRVRLCEQRVDTTERTLSTAPSPDLGGLAQDLTAAWGAPGVTMRTRQQLLRSLVKEIIADVDEEAHEIVLTIHWHGGHHSQLRIAKPRTGEHGCRTPQEALAIMRSMAGKWSDEHIAATLNRMGLPTGHGKTWTAHRVASVRSVNDIHAYRSAHKDGEWLTMSEAAAKLGVTNHRIRYLIKEGLLPADQVVERAPYQIRASDLLDPKVVDAIARTDRPCRTISENQISMFSIT
jgi:hypothetical protein